MGNKEPKSWGIKLVVGTTVITCVIVVTFFSRLIADAKQGYKTNMEAKKSAIMEKEKNIKQIGLEGKVKVKSLNKNWLTKDQSKKAEALMARSDCIACHNPAVPTPIAPKFKEIAKKYINADMKAIAILVNKVRKGGQGNWQPKYIGIMTPHQIFLDGSKMTDAHIELMVKKILDTK